MIMVLACLCVALTSNAKTGLAGSWNHEMTASELALFGAGADQGPAKVDVSAGNIDFNFSGKDAFVMNLALKMAVKIQDQGIELGISYTAHIAYKGTYDFTPDKAGKGELDLDSDSTDVTLTDMELTGSAAAALDDATKEQVKKSIEEATKQQLKQVDLTDADWTVKQLTKDKLVLENEDDDGQKAEFTFTPKQ